MVQRGCSSHVVFALPHCSRAQLVRSVYEWEVVHRQVVIRGLPQNIATPAVAQQLMRDMITVGAIEHGIVPARPYIVAVEEAERVEVLAALEASGFAKQVPGADPAGWILTAHAISKAHLSCKVTRPRLCFRSLSGLSLRSLSSYQLLDRLLHGGWTVVQAPSRRMLQRAPPHTVGGPTCCRSQMRATSLRAASLKFGMEDLLPKLL